MLVISFQAIVLCDDTETISDAQDAKPQAPKKIKSDVKKSDKKPQDKESKKKSKHAIKTIIFANCRVNEIMLVITDNKNKQSQVTIKMGHELTYHHEAGSIQKVVCYEKLTPNTTVNKSDLDNHSVIVFNDNQHTEKYHFITIAHQTAALKHARMTKDTDAFDKIGTQTIYRP